MGRAREDAQETFWRAYARENDGNAWNAHYERPAVLSLAGDVAGLRLLDAGCGSGGHAALLHEKGATVSCVDKSAAMVKIASQRLPDGTPILLADLAEPLPFENGSFDVVLASLVMHYLRDWGHTLREFLRVLAPRGRLIISTHHPFMDHAAAQGVNYFATYDWTEEWSKAGQTMTMRFWHRPLTAMIRELQDAGFAIERIEEPAPDDAVRELDPRAWHSLTTEPRFIFFAARSTSPATERL